MGCSLHSSGHGSSRASSNESKNNSHVPLIRLFSPTQAWAMLHSLRAHHRPGPELQVHSRVELNALSAWGLMKLLLCVALVLSAPPGHHFRYSLRGKSQDPQKACGISLWAGTALKCQGRGVGTASQVGGEVWQSRWGDALTRTPFNPQPLLPAADPSQVMPSGHHHLSESAPGSTFTCIIPSTLTGTPGAGIRCPHFTGEKMRLGEV